MILYEGFSPSGTWTVNTTSNIPSWGLHTPRKGITTDYSEMRQGHPYQEALYPDLLAPDRSMVQEVG
jgi:hypothetical protein